MLANARDTASRCLACSCLYTGAEAIAETTRYAGNVPFFLFSRLFSSEALRGCAVQVQIQQTIVQTMPDVERTCGQSEGRSQSKPFHQCCLMSMYTR